MSESPLTDSPLAFDPSLKPMLEAHIGDARRQKESLIAEGDFTKALPQLLVVIRNDKPVMHLWLNGSGSDDVANMLFMGVQAFRADACVLVFEGWLAKQVNDPETGEPWGPGGMAAYADKHGVGDVIGEGLTAYAVTSDLRGAQISQSFTVYDKKVTWETIGEDAKATGGGYFMDATVAGFKRAPEARRLVENVLDALGEEMPRSHKEAFMDGLNIVKMTEALGSDVEFVAVAVATGDPDRAAMLKVMDGENLADLMRSPTVIRAASKKATAMVKAGQN